MKDLVVVITGASCGIGKATALAFAKNGAKVALVARRKNVLEELSRQIEQQGSSALPFAADISNEEQVADFAKAVYEKFGKIDVWVNNAAVTAFGEFDQVPSHVFRRVMEVNFFGYVYGARAVIPIFKKQKRGHLINVSSVVGTIGQPYTSAYVASKFAIRGFSESLRWELEESGIQVCTVLPGSIDTPIFHQGANYMGKAVKPMPPIYDPEEVAEKILNLVEKPEQEVFVGAIPRLLGEVKKFAPELTTKFFASQVLKEHFQDKEAETSEGNLFQPMEEFSGAHGGWK